MSQLLLSVLQQDSEGFLFEHDVATLLLLGQRLLLSLHASPRSASA